MDLGEEGVVMAFSLLLEMGQHSSGDFWMSMKMYGFGESEESYALMDECMLEVIDRRVGQDVSSGSDLAAATEEVVKVRRKWEEKDVMWLTGEFKTGRPNKQQRGQLDRHRAEWGKERCKELSEEGQDGDWMGNAVWEIEDDRKMLNGYRLSGYIEKSVKRLKESKEGVNGGEEAEKEEA
jgi:hypothetical protein